MPATAAPPDVNFRPATSARVATGWTKPLQYSLIAWFLLYAIWSVVTPFLVAGPIAAFANETLQRNAQLNPDVTPPAADVLSTINGVMTVVLAITAAIGVAIAVLAIIGALRRWTWVFYAALVLLGLQSVSFPFTVISAFSPSAFSTLKLPVAVTATSVAFGFPAIALFAWMLVAAIRRGPWAMTRVAA
jgi:hypothetical protein